MGSYTLLKVDIQTNRCILLCALLYVLSATATQSEHILVCSYEPLVQNSTSSENDQQCKNFSAVNFAEELHLDNHHALSQMMTQDIIFMSISCCLSIIVSSSVTEIQERYTLKFCDVLHNTIPNCVIYSQACLRISQYLQLVNGRGFCLYMH